MQKMPFVKVAKVRERIIETCVLKRIDIPHCVHQHAQMYLVLINDFNM